MVDWLSRFYKGFTGLRSAFTMAGGGQATPVFGLMARRIAFTMAEILLSLTIIGVVAAITLPSLTGNINERTWNTQRKALFSRLSQAVALMPQVRGYGEFSKQSGGIDVSSNAGEVFLASGLSKVFKLNNICDADHLSDCGIPDVFNTYGTASKVYLSDIRNLGDLALYEGGGCGLMAGSLNRESVMAVAFETSNGENVLLYYNPVCKFSDLAMKADLLENGIDIFSILCANFVYDLNGKKGPNTVGKDVGFMSLFYGDTLSLVAPSLLSRKIDGDQSTRNQYCREIEGRIPNMEELASVMVNTSLSGFGEYAGWRFESVTPFVSSSQPTVKKLMVLDMANYAIFPFDVPTEQSSFCIKRD